MHDDPAAVATLIRSILTKRGPLEEEELYDALVAAQAPMGDDPEDRFDGLMSSDDVGPVFPLTDGRYCWLPAVLKDRTFTHRVTEREIEHDLLDETPDLDALTILVTDRDHPLLLDGVPVRTAWPFDDSSGRVPPQAVGEHGSLLLPEGRLASLHVRPDDLVGLRLTDEGLQINAIDEVAPIPKHFAELVTSILPDDDAGYIEEIVATLCVLDDELFRQPLAPINEMLSELNFARTLGRVALPGFDFDAAFVEHRIRLIQDRHGLEEDEAMAVAQLVTLFSEVEELAERMADAAATETADLDDADAATLAEPDGASHAAEIASVHLVTQYLSDPDLASVVLDETLYSLRGSPASLIALAGGLEHQAPREARAALRWLQARAYEQLGDVETAEKALDEAAGLDPDWSLTLLDLARYASDRGDATRALGLLRRAGMEEDTPFVTALRRYQPMPRSDMRRNAPCWCGSGRKYKACHLNNEQLSLAERAEWLYEKAQEHLRTNRWPTVLVGYAELRVRENSEEDLLDAVFNPFVRDALLAEGGAFQDFFVRRGRLLPEDERELAEQWLDLKRSVYEIVSVKSDQGLTLQDVVTQDHHDVDYQETSDLHTGDLVCGRLFPVESTLRCFGGLEPVRRDNLDAVLDALSEQDCRAVIEAVSR